jgi:hypothetical protein
MPEGTYDNTARVVSLETGYVDDQGEVGEDAGTPAGRDPETDEDVTVVSFVQDAPVLYLPLLLRNYTAPVSFPLHVGDAILVHPVAYPGQVYYSRVLQMPGDLPAGGRFYLSSQRDAVAGVLVDDALAILLHGSVVFTYPFSDGTYVPAPAIVELPRTTMETLVGQDVTIEYRDVYGINGEASVMWLIWMP